MFGAADSELLQRALEILDDGTTQIANAIESDKYVFWLGSGISRDRVPGLGPVLSKLLETLRVRSLTNDPYRQALDEVLGLAVLSAADRSAIDFDKPAASWPCLDTILTQLGRRYADVLDVQVFGEREDHLLWDLVDVRRTYGASRPDAEHLSIALLAAEGLCDYVVSANWDGLLEAAFVEINTGGIEVSVAVTGRELRDSTASTKLLKFHGCAVLATKNPSQYRELVVGRKSQITRWPHDPQFTVMNSELIRLARDRRSLIVGLSAQDSDIRDVFASADATSPWTWSDSPPPHLVVGPRLDGDQDQLLQLSYPHDYSSHRDEIRASSHVGLPAKPFLFGLYVHTVFSKRQGLLERSGSSAAVASDLQEGVLASRAAHLRRRRGNWDTVVRTVAKAVSDERGRFEMGVTSRSPQYLPSTGTRRDRIASSTSEHALPLLALMDALVWLGHVRGWWTGELKLSASHPHELVISNAGRRREILFVENEIVAARVERESPHPSMLTVIIATGSPQPNRRSPSSRYGRTGKVEARRVYLSRLGVGRPELLDAFEREIKP